MKRFEDTLPTRSRLTFRSLGLVALLCSVFAGSAYANFEGDYPLPECRRWNSGVSCEQVFSINSGDSCSAAQNVSTKYYKEVYFGTAQAACDAAVKYGDSSLVVTAMIDPTDENFANCRLADGSLYTTVTRPITEPEEVCSYKVQGPYTNFTDYAFSSLIYPPNTNSKKTYYGAEWREEQRIKIRHLNRQRNNTTIKSTRLFSDIIKDKTKVGKKPDHLALFDYYKRGGLTEIKGQKNTGEIHHIIPVTDRKGCKCGTNSYKNAVMISRKLNKELSNDTSNEMFNAIIKRYRVY